MMQTVNLPTPKPTVYSKKTVDLRHSNRRFTPGKMSSKSPQRSFFVFSY